MFTPHTISYLTAEILNIFPDVDVPSPNWDFTVSSTLFETQDLGNWKEFISSLWKSNSPD
jgi:hypothetical protein